MKLFLKIVCALVIGLAAAPSVTANESTCCPMTKIDAQTTEPSAGCTFLRVAGRIAPYALILGWFKYVHDESKEAPYYIKAKNKVLDLVAGIWFYESVKEDAKDIKALFSRIINGSPAAC